MIKIIFYDTARGQFSSVILSPEHLIFTGVQGVETIKAREVKVGTLLIQENGKITPVIKTTVARINQSVSSPVTDIGRIVVNGVLVSCYENVDSHVFTHITYSRMYTFLDKLPPFLKGYALMDYNHEKLFVSFVETSIYWYRQVTGIKDTFTDIAKNVDDVVKTVAKEAKKHDEQSKKESAKEEEEVIKDL